MIFSDALYHMAELAVTKFGLKGIDWAALAENGRASVWDRDYIDQYMAPTDALMIANVGGMVFDVGTDPNATRAQLSTNEQILQSIANTVGQYTGLPNLDLMQFEVGLSREAMRYLVSQCYQTAQYAFRLHADETIHHSGMSDAEIAAHASSTVGMMNALVNLRTLGVYKALGIDQSQSGQASQQGLGIAQNVLIALVVVAVAGLAYLAWMLVTVHDMNQKNAIVAKSCENAQAAGDAATTQLCVQTLSDPNKNAGTQPLQSLLQSLMPYALGGVAIYALYLAAPYLMKEIFTRKSAT